MSEEFKLIYYGGKEILINLKTIELYIENHMDVIPKVVEALTLSEEKWLKIAAGKALDQGYRNCELCKFAKRYCRNCINYSINNTELDDCLIIGWGQWAEIADCRDVKIFDNFEEVSFKIYDINHSSYYESVLCALFIARNLRVISNAVVYVLQERKRNNASNKK